MTIQRPVTDMVKDVVLATQAVMLPYLKREVDSKIEQLHYEYGHPLAIVNTMIKMTKPQSFQFKKYPLIALFEDITQTPAGDGYEWIIKPRIIIANQTSPNYTRKERDDKNFKPILIPIYEELIRQFRLSTLFVFDYRKRGDMIIHPFWGSEGLYGNEGNVFADAMDCIEIKGIELTTRREYCPVPGGRQTQTNL